MKTTALILTAAIASIATANAVPVLQSSVTGSARADATGYLTFDGGATNDVNVTVSTTGPDSGFFSTTSNSAAQPAFSANNNNHFAIDADDNDYISSGTTTSAPPASLTLTFATPQNYLGLLWGSVDSYNTLTFLLGGVAVPGASFTGTDALNPANGFRGVGGSTYVNITGFKFDSVLLTSNGLAFEIDNVAYGSVPDGGMTAALLGLSMSGIAFVRRKLAA